MIVECGAGTAIPTVRHFCEHLASTQNALLIRINPREPTLPPGPRGTRRPIPFPYLDLEVGALEGLRAIDQRWNT
ncbi:MAG: hypothetical protein JO112_14245 [Planctomycetes bacterium]|nr:hypothetical protein [Planctomycetota bacterium]